MHNRRNFLVQTSLATASIALLKPFKSIALSPTAGSSLNQSKISIFNISSLTSNKGLGARAISVVKNLQSSLQEAECSSLLLATGNVINVAHGSREDHVVELGKLSDSGLDCILPGYAELTKGEGYCNELLNERNLRSHLYKRQPHLLSYQLVKKGNIKVGMIAGNAIKPDATVINKTAKYLKERENCNLIVLIQNNTEQQDIQKKSADIDLARLTLNVDVIVTDSKPYAGCKTYIARNLNEHEVIISYAGSNNNPGERIEFTYNSRMDKINMTSHRVA